LRVFKKLDFLGCIHGMTSLVDEKRATRAFSRPLFLPNHVTEWTGLRQVARGAPRGYLARRGTW